MDLIGLYVLIALMSYILVQAVVIETAYFEKYENQYAEMVREHDKQLAISSLISSQRNWVQQAETLRQALLEEKARRNRAERELKITNRETYYILRKLENRHPLIYDELMAKNKFPDNVFNPFSFFDLMKGLQCRP